LRCGGACQHGVDFVASRVSPPTTEPSALVVADFNHDGRDDVAVVNDAFTFLSVQLGNGDGRFGAPSDIDVSSVPSGIVAADFNRDGNVDIAVTDASGVTVLLGNGDGTFGAPQPFPAGAGAAGIAVGDFNRDDEPDLVVVSPGTNEVRVLLGLRNDSR
jgi:FG-GAP-like repeat